MFDTFLRVLEAALHLWDDKEKNKYVDKYIKLKEEWYAEFNKPANVRSNAVIDNIEFELRVLGDAFSSNVRKPQA